MLIWIVTKSKSNLNRTPTPTPMASPATNLNALLATASPALAAKTKGSIEGADDYSWEVETGGKKVTKTVDTSKKLVEFHIDEHDTGCKLQAWCKYPNKDDEETWTLGYDDVKDLGYNPCVRDSVISKFEASC
ncbi:hypothetical protein F5B20DRAFT_575053 [Whalleya microplaca]|nr:hypothetical protein F5B20DRAFT_575053 [Whalleya microplaca]